MNTTSRPNPPPPPSLPMANMQYDSITTNDGCKIAFQTSLPLKPPSDQTDFRYSRVILLIHGFSGSSAYFKKNFDGLSKDALVIAPDLRGHGESGHSSGGYHVARLAMDLKELVSHIKTLLPHLDDDPSPEVGIVPIGCSIGAAVLWTYVELFTDDDFIGMLFVDQAPLQDRSPFGNWNEEKAHRTCYDEATMRVAQTMLLERPEELYKGLVKDCLGYRFKPQEDDDLSDERRLKDEEFFIGESKKCDPVWLAKLLADHTRYDHREACEKITVPIKVIAAERSGCFTVPGVMEVRELFRGKAANAGIFCLGGHWCFWEDSEEFNSAVIRFTQKYVFSWPPRDSP